MSGTGSETPGSSDTRDAARARRARRRLQRPVGRAYWIRTAAVAVFDALAIWVIAQFASNQSWAVMTLFIVAFALVNWAYLNPRAQASRWLTPGLVLMVVFVLYPVLYTAYISFTNYQTGNLLDKDQAIARLVDVDIRTGEAGETLTMSVYRDRADALALLVAGDATEPFFGLLRSGDDDTEIRPAGELPADLDPAAPPAAIGDFELLPRLQLTGEARRLEDAEVNLPDGGAARVQTLSQAVVVTAGKRFTYVESSDSLIDNQTGRTCRSGEGTFFCDDVPEAEVQAVALLERDTPIVCEAGSCDHVPLYALDQSLAGWKQVVGFDNYAEVLTNDRIREPFVRVLAWNVVFAFGSVLLNFAMGLGLALALKRDNMRGRAIYRSIYIVPYAIPGFLSILVWRGLLNTQFGKVNGVLDTFGLPAVDWLGSGRNAMIAVFLVNLWLGFPYMFLICSGALTSIPEELLEASRVDGATPWKSFRMITLPLLLVSTAPLLIGAFAFNFNNFVLIFLLTNGGPPLTGYDVPVGSTDLLISFTFDIAAGAGRGSQYSLATAIVVIIFLVLATTSALSFRLTKKLEDIYDQS
ncbi:MAG: ABC transporter permease subunit [Ilumatobacteraceae bacterium]